MTYTDDYRLCYIDRPWAYFTTQALDKQWADDWNDAPYEHNAGSPYTWNPTVHDRELKAWIANPEPRWDIGMVAFSVNLCTPEEEHFNSPYSIEMINDKAVPWLQPYRWDREHEANRVEIWAGASYSEFVRLVHEAGGTIYEPIEAQEQS